MATRILLDENTCKTKNEYAKSLMQEFVLEIPHLYDTCLLTCNFHYLLHINEDAKRYGSLNGISAFKYENHLQKLKKFVKKMQQCCNTII